MQLIIFCFICSLSVKNSLCAEKNNCVHKNIKFFTSDELSSQLVMQIVCFRVSILPRGRIRILMTFFDSKEHVTKMSNTPLKVQEFGKLIASKKNEKS